MTQHELEVRAFLTDIVQSAASIEEMTRELSFEAFHEQRTTRLAVEREFITIGEALRGALRLEPELDSLIPDARTIIDFRNVLVHGYRKIEPQVVWQIVKDDLPRLASLAAERLSRL